MYKKSILSVIVKDEVQDIAEWIVHHINIGFDKIVVFNNQSMDGTLDTLNYLSSLFDIDVIPWPMGELDTSRKTKQTLAYDYCIEQYRDQCDWMMFLDADEFLIPPLNTIVTRNALQDFLSEYDPYSAVAINWRIFGSSGFATSKGRMVMEAFCRRAADHFGVNRHTKMIFKPKHALEAVNPHYIKTDSPAVNVLKQPITWESPGITDAHHIAHGDWTIHHYILRSMEHVQRRLIRRQPDGSARNMQQFLLHDKNDILDYAAYPWARNNIEILSRIGFDNADVKYESSVLQKQKEGLFIKASTAICFADSFSFPYLSGWAHDTIKSDNEPIDLWVAVDGQIMQKYHCELPRQDVSNSGIAKDLVGYKLDLSHVVKRGFCHTIEFFDSLKRPVTVKREGRMGRVLLLVQLPHSSHLQILGTV